MTPHFSFLSKVTRELHLSFPNTKILPALGNHDSHPADFFADPAIDSQDAKKYYSGKDYIREFFTSRRNCFRLSILDWLNEIS
jgi:hypothetical protein